jgi:hypothetical protein
MHSILLFNEDDRPFDSATVGRIFQSEAGFRDVRFSEPGGDMIGAEYFDFNGSTIVRLTGDRRTISMRGTSDVELHAALIIQRSLGTPLRMVDSDYSFDLTFQGISNVDELRDAMDEAGTA